jgi:hypothetical protein
MNKTRASFISLGLLLLCAAVPALQADDSCSPCNSNNGSSCSTSSNSCDNGCRNNCGDRNCNGNCSNACNTGCSTLIVTRDTHSNTAYRYLPFAYIEAECEFNGGIALGYEFQQTFKSRDLANCMFGTNVLSFKGSQVAGRTDNDLIADNFGLSPLFQGTLRVCPQVRNHNLKFESYWAFDNWLEGLYLRADLTFTHQERRLFEDCNTCFTSTVVTTTPFPPGYMGVGSVAPAPDIATALGGTFLFGDMQTPWSYGKFDRCKHSDNKVAGFSLDVGYNFWKECDSHLGIFLRYEAPTGTKINGRQRAADNVFFPVIGNMHHNGLGGGLTAHKELWSNDCGDSIEIYLDGYATHLFKNCQVRSFNLVRTSTSTPLLNTTFTNNCCNSCGDNDCNGNCNNNNDCDDSCSTNGTASNSLGCLSRYMLLKQLTPTTATGADGSPLGLAFTGTLINAINFTTRNVKSSIGVTGDATIAFLYRHKGFSLEVGYNIFGRQREKLCLRPGVPPCDLYDPNFSYGLKGCTGDYCFTYTLSGAPTTILTGVPTATPLNATSSSATITSCGSVDNAVLSLSTAGVCVSALNPFIGSGSPANAIFAGTDVPGTLAIASTSDPAIALSDANLDIESGRVKRLLSNKGFLAMNYGWDDCDWMPYIGIGGEVEGGSHCCDFKQWGVWLKGGFSF